MIRFNPAFDAFPVRIIPIPQFADLALREVSALGLKNALLCGSIIIGTADWSTAYRLVYESRLTMRILLPLVSGAINNKDELYNCAAKVGWEKILHSDSTFAVDIQGQHRQFNRLGYAALVIKDAIVDNLRHHNGVRPSVDTDNPAVRIHAYLQDTSETVISLDIGLGSMYKRGYRSAGGEAPLNEVLASCLLEKVQYSPRYPLVDPFCGSGTILMEAAMRILSIPAGYYRFNTVNDAVLFRHQIGSLHIWRKVKQSAHDIMHKKWDLLQKQTNGQLLVWGGDIDPRAVQLSKDTLAQLPEDFSLVSVSQQDAHDITCPEPMKEKTGIILTNPPYDERIQTTDIQQLYIDFGLKAKKSFPNWDIHILTGNSKAAKAFPLRTSRKFPMYNGPIKCTLLSASILPSKEKQEG